ncbi:MAG: LysE family translocator [Rubricella sp.]
MTHELLLALAAFAFVTSVTPGPNNLMLMASGANFGPMRTVPHLLGVALGFVGLAIPVGLGLGRAFEAFPALRTALAVMSIIYMAWLAWKIATSAPPEDRDGTGKPLTFLQAAAFQWVNPKAWAMALTAMTVYAPGGSVGAVLLVGLVFGAINLPSVWLWVILGQQMRRILTNAIRLRLFNWTMAMLLVASLWPLVR